VTRAAPSGFRQWWRSHGIRMRLTALYVVVMLVVLGVYIFGVYTVIRRNALEALDQQLRGDFFWVAGSVFQQEDGTFDLNEPDLLVAAAAGLPWVQVWNEDGSIVLFRNSEARRRAIPAAQAQAVRPADSIVTVATDRSPVRILSYRGHVGTEQVVMQVARSEEGMRQDMRDLQLIFVFGLPVATALAGLGGYLFARRVLAPIEHMTEQARTITAERLGDRLPVANPDDEMGRLTTVFNETLGRLEASFAQMRQFTTDVSHELRTPLTAIRSVGEVGLRGTRDEAAYRGIIGSMLEEVERLADLVDRLLVLSRAETRFATLSLEEVDLAELADEVAGHLGVLAEEKGQTLRVEREADPVVRGDRVVLRQALINLVDNAIKFTPADGSVRVRVAEAEGEATVEVIDDGPGVPPEAREHVFDRFYRREGAEGVGFGLGLSLARGGVEAVGGRLVLVDTGRAGTTFRITLPASGARREAARGGPVAPQSTPEPTKPDAHGPAPMNQKEK
jgi:heavy metal sensor kinase